MFDMCAEQMPGQERRHFGDLVTEISNGRSKYFWRCQYCNWQMGGKNFQNNKARVHLSGNPDLKCGLISRVCDKAPEDVMNKFSKLELVKREERKSKAEKRKRQSELLYNKKRVKSEQQKLDLTGKGKVVDDELVDAAWGEFFFGLDVACNKISHPLFRHAIEMTQKSSLK